MVVSLSRMLRVGHRAWSGVARYLVVGRGSEGDLLAAVRRVSAGPDRVARARMARTGDGAERRGPRTARPRVALRGIPARLQQAARLGSSHDDLPAAGVAGRDARAGRVDQRATLVGPRGARGPGARGGLAARGLARAGHRPEARSGRAPLLAARRSLCRSIEWPGDRAGVGVGGC